MINIEIINEYNKIKEEIYKLFNFRNTEKIISIDFNENEITEIVIYKNDDEDDDYIFDFYSNDIHEDECYSKELIKIINNYILLAIPYVYFDDDRSISISIWKVKNNEILNKLKYILSI